MNDGTNIGAFFNHPKLKAFDGRLCLMNGWILGLNGMPYLSPLFGILFKSLPLFMCKPPIGSNAINSTIELCTKQKTSLF